MACVVAAAGKPVHVLRLILLGHPAPDIGQAAFPRLHLRNNTDGQKEEFVEFHMPAAESL